MSVSEATTTPTRSSASVLGWVLGGIALVAVLTAVAIALWPASEADKAYDDGVRVGEGVGQLYGADSTAEVDAALTELDAAVTDTRAHAGDAVADQAADQEDALARAADGFVGAITTDDGFESELYQSELDVALNDLSSQASDFRAEGPEVHQAFWDGVADGLPAN
jgi:hypothetical protein